MVLLILLLLAYYPYRRHDGQLMVLLMLGYAVHRFINESLRIEPTGGWGTYAVAVGQRGNLPRGGGDRNLPVPHDAVAVERRRAASASGTGGVPSGRTLNGET